MKFTVLMPIHNEILLRHIKRSTNSVIKNTLQPNEFLIIIDGELTKEKISYLKIFANKKRYIRVIFLKKSGLTKVLNLGIQYSKYNIIARADADDFNFPKRFELQLNFFKNKKADLVGSNIIEKYNKTKYSKKIISEPSLLQMIFINKFNHMTVIFNKNKIKKIGCYPDILYKEDFCMWILAKINGFKMYNSNEVLVKCMEDNNKIKRRKNFKSISSEFKTFYFISRNKPILIPISFLALIVRILYLSLPKNLNTFVLLNFLRIK
jgi:amylovoran biosynthesis glycosyltransferase AmsE